VGARSERAHDVRIVAATNANDDVSSSWFVK
jgi:transcriptional regulator with PAS, ATPase and Fis domain